MQILGLCEKKKRQMYEFVVL